MDTSASSARAKRPRSLSTNNNSGVSNARDARQRSKSVQRDSDQDSILGSDQDADAAPSHKRLDARTHCGALVLPSSSVSRKTLREPARKQEIRAAAALASASQGTQDDSSDDDYGNEEDTVNVKACSSTTRKSAATARGKASCVNARSSNIASPYEELDDSSSDSCSEKPPHRQRRPTTKRKARGGSSRAGPVSHQSASSSRRPSLSISGGALSVGQASGGSASQQLPHHASVVPAPTSQGLPFELHSITLWELEETVCFAVASADMRVADGCISRRLDTNYVNGTKLLNAAGISRGKRDTALKSINNRDVVTIGPMALKGVWVPLAIACELARRYGLFPRCRELLLAEDPLPLLAAPPNSPLLRSIATLTHERAKRKASMVLAGMMTSAAEHTKLICLQALATNMADALGLEPDELATDKPSRPRPSHVLAEQHSRNKIDSASPDACDPRARAPSLVPQAQSTRATKRMPASSRSSSEHDDLASRKPEVEFGAGSLPSPDTSARDSATASRMDAPSHVDQPHFPYAYAAYTHAMPSPHYGAGPSMGAYVSEQWPPRYGFPSSTSQQRYSPLPGLPINALSMNERPGQYHFPTMPPASEWHSRARAMAWSAPNYYQPPFSYNHGAGGNIWYPATTTPMTRTTGSNASSSSSSAALTSENPYVLVTGSSAGSPPLPPRSTSTLAAPTPRRAADNDVSYHLEKTAALVAAAATVASDSSASRGERAPNPRPTQASTDEVPTSQRISQPADGSVPASHVAPSVLLKNCGEAPAATSARHPLQAFERDHLHSTRELPLVLPSMSDVLQASETGFGVTLPETQASGEQDGSRSQEAYARTCSLESANATPSDGAAPPADVEDDEELFRLPSWAVSSSSREATPARGRVTSARSYLGRYGPSSEQVSYGEVQTQDAPPTDVNEDYRYSYDIHRSFSGYDTTQPLASDE